MHAARVIPYHGSVSTTGELTIDGNATSRMSMHSPYVSGVSPSSVLNGYAGLDNVFDELISRDGKLRSHWQTFVEGLDEIGLEEFSHRWREAQQLIHENGVTYNVYGDPRGMDRPWQL